MYLLANRALLALPFGVLALAGVLFLLYPSVAMTTIMPENEFTFVWSLLLTLSSLASVYGILHPKAWFWEYTSSIMLMALLLIYGIVIFAYAGTNSLNYLAPSLMVLVPASMLIPRFLAVQKEIQDNH